MHLDQDLTNKLHSLIIVSGIRLKAVFALNAAGANADTTSEYRLENAPRGSTGAHDILLTQDTKCSSRPAGNGRSWSLPWPWSARASRRCGPCRCGGCSSGMYAATCQGGGRGALSNRRAPGQSSPSGAAVSQEQADQALLSSYWTVSRIMQRVEEDLSSVSRKLRQKPGHKIPPDIMISLSFLSVIPTAICLYYCILLFSGI